MLQRMRCNRCLLYTSDAADDLLCVDLGGRRILKKKIEQIDMLAEALNKRVELRGLLCGHLMRTHGQQYELVGVEVLNEGHSGNKHADKRNVDAKCKQQRHEGEICLLYTSDAADDLLCVDLGGRRIIK